MADRRTIKSVSDDLNKLELSHNDLDLRHRLLHKDVKENTRDINEIKDYFKWFMKVVVGLFASAVAAFVVQGGLI